jgi:hypothetical protein
MLPSDQRSECTLGHAPITPSPFCSAITALNLAQNTALMPLVGNGSTPGEFSTHHTRAKVQDFASVAAELLRAAAALYGIQCKVNPRYKLE